MQEKAKVYFTDLRTRGGKSLLDKLVMLIEQAGIGQIDFEQKLTAIKIHFGEPGNLAYLRPNYARVVAEQIRAAGGLPFLTDCNTLYPGRRKNAPDHLAAAYENGYSPFSTGCHVIIGDGVKGTDDIEVPVVGGEYVKAAKIGRAVMDADVLISLSHFKGHELTGFGGAIKNIGMGCGSRAGKMEQHAAGKPVVNDERCRACGQCLPACGQEAISAAADTGKASVDHDKCVGCGRCIGACNFDAISNPDFCANFELNCKMAEYAKAVLDGRPSFHITLVRDISPFCDCHGCNDAPILPDVGMFASFDIVALDQACADACLNQTPLPGTRLTDRLEKAGEHAEYDHFQINHPDAEWESCLAHAEKIGLGTRSYELIALR